MTSFREARANDYWRNAYKRDYPYQIKRIRFEGGTVFDGMDINLRTGINALIGKNGTGKSNCLRSLYNSLCSDQSNRRPFKNLLDTSCLNLEIELDGTESQVAREHDRDHDNDDDDGNACFLFDPCTLIPDVQKLFQKQEYVNELIDSYQSIELSQDELSTINYLTNSTYSSVKIYNIEDEYDDYPALPFFEVVKSYCSYDSRTMGLGELSLFYYFWLIDRIHTSNQNAVLFIEEPESFIPPLIQKRVCNVLAELCSVKGIVCLVSTHSEHILSRIPRSHIQNMRVRDAGTRVRTIATRHEQLTVLGLTAPKKGLLITEDAAAETFLKQLIRTSDIFVTDSFHFKISNGEAAVKQDIDRFKGQMPGFPIVGVFDGDARANYMAEKTSNSNILFLPSEQAPEQVLFEGLTRISNIDIADRLNVSLDDYETAQQTVDGLEHHDVIPEMARALDLDRDRLQADLFTIWCANEDNLDAVGYFLSDLISIFPEQDA